MSTTELLIWSFFVIVLPLAIAFRHGWRPRMTEAEQAEQKAKEVRGFAQSIKKKGQS